MLLTNELFPIEFISVVRFTYRSVFSRSTAAARSRLARHNAAFLWIPQLQPKLDRLQEWIWGARRKTRVLARKRTDPSPDQHSRIYPSHRGSLLQTSGSNLSVCNLI